MGRKIKIFFIVLIILTLIGAVSFLFFKNRELNKAYESATQQVTELQAKLSAIGTFTDVYTIKTDVKMGQEIKEEDLILQTVPTSSVPSNVITNSSDLVGNYYRIGLQPGVTLTSDFVVVEEYIGAVYERDVFMDSLPVGTQVGDYIDVRVVLPGGDEFVVFAHRRVNARYENAIKMKFDEADLWIYTSMMVDRALYKDDGLKIYATKYVDPGSHEDTVAYYPVRKEVVDIMNISGNLTDVQRARMWNASLRASIDTKLSYYADDLNRDAANIASGWNEEESRVDKAEKYYEDLLNAIARGDADATSVGSSGLVDPTTANSTETMGSLNSGESTSTATVDGLKDSEGNASVIASQDYLDNVGDNLFEDETPIQ